MAEVYLQNEPTKLQYLKNANLMSTELVGTHDDEMSSFSFAYKMVTSQGTFTAIRWDVFTSDDIPQPEGWSGDNWTSSKEFTKAWEQRVKDELLATRKDLVKGTLMHFRKLIVDGADPKDALKDLLLEENDSDNAINNSLKEFKKDKKAEKVWKSVKM